MVKERGRGGVVQNFQTGGSDPAKQVISERVRGNESVPCWVVSIEVSEDKSVRGVRKDVRIEGPGARVRGSVSDGRGVEVKKLKRRVVGEKDFNTGVVRVGVLGRQRGDRNKRESQVRVDESEDTTTSVMSTGGNRALSTECPVRAEGIITRDLELFG